MSGIGEGRSTFRPPIRYWVCVSLLLITVTVSPSRRAAARMRERAALLRPCAQRRGDYLGLLPLIQADHRLMHDPYSSGPPRDWSVVWVVDVITGTGLRPHEVFALLLDEIDLDASDPYLDVTGTLVEVKGAGTGGWMRKPVPKSENGWRASCSRTTPWRPYTRR
ncbi:hypothetical protein ACIBEK_00065 [Nocardia fusca]|uniref:hypothetical protein n=1 Tax=Nocardia fusca TaxID=941183 RepID=UPI00379535E1